MMSDDERIACKDMQERIAKLEEQVNELRTILGGPLCPKHGEPLGPMSYGDGCGTFTCGCTLADE